MTAQNRVSEADAPPVHYVAIREAENWVFSAMIRAPL
jgi:hypothetical protein